MIDPEWQLHSHGCRTPPCITNPEHWRGAVAVYRKEVSSMSLWPPAHHVDIIAASVSWSPALRISPLGTDPARTDTR